MNLQHFLCSVEFSYVQSSLIGPENWATFAPACGGSMQSPINLTWAKAIIKGLSKLTIQNIYLRPESINYANGGEGISVTMNYANPNNRPRLIGGPLQDQYVLFGFHWH